MGGVSFFVRPARSDFRTLCFSYPICHVVDGPYSSFLDRRGQDVAVPLTFWVDRQRCEAKSGVAPRQGRVDR